MLSMGSPRVEGRDRTIAGLVELATEAESMPTAVQSIAFYQFARGAMRIDEPLLLSQVVYECVDQQDSSGGR
jgi:hypothetical protein